jgi:hypothetical protein
MRHLNRPARTVSTYSTHRQYSQTRYKIGNLLIYIPIPPIPPKCGHYLLADYIPIPPIPPMPGGIPPPPIPPKSEWVRE